MAQEQSRLRFTSGLRLFLDGVPLLRSGTPRIQWNSIDAPLFPVAATIASGVAFTVPIKYVESVCDCMSHQSGNSQPAVDYFAINMASAVMWNIVLYAWCLITAILRRISQSENAIALKEVKRVVYFAAYPQMFMYCGWAYWSYQMSHMGCQPPHSLFTEMLFWGSMAVWFSAAFARIAVVYRAARALSEIS